MRVRVRVMGITAALASALAGASPSHASPEGTYRLRNASRTPLRCMLRVQRGDSFIRFALNPGREVRQTLDLQHGPRLLICSSSVYRSFSFRVEPGRTYELTETSSAMLRIRLVTDD